MSSTFLGNKIVVVGPNGSGKTTFAKKLSDNLNLPFYELDSISWLPDWKELPNAEFRERINEITQNDKWIIDGNYARNQDLTIGKAETVIWLNYSIVKSVYRVVKRSAYRMYTQKPLWHNNRESFRRALSPKNSIILFAMKSFKGKNARYEQMMMKNDFKTINWIRIRNKRDESGFWSSLK